MTALLSAILIATAFLTATLSGMIGMGGGILLLAVMFSVMHSPELVVFIIPLHGAVQLVSNSTRTLAFIDAVDWPTVKRFSLGTVPGIALGMWIWYLLDGNDAAQPYLKILIGIYILTAVFLPKPKAKQQTHSSSGFMPLGFVAGTAALIVGATGPLIAPLFARRDFVKERLVATKAMCQMVTHFEKLIAFGILFGTGIGKIQSLSTILGVAIAMGVAVILGTLTGKRLLKLISPELFVKLYRVALVVAGSKVLLVDGVYQILK